MTERPRGRSPAQAQVVRCTTSATEPVVASAWVHDGAFVVAVGLHSPYARELDAALTGQSPSVVKTVGMSVEDLVIAAAAADAT